MHRPGQSKELFECGCRSASMWMLRCGIDGDQRRQDQAPGSHSHRHPEAVASRSFVSLRRPQGHDPVHPVRAFYIFGGEDATLGGRVLSWCRDVIYIPTAYCMNLAATVNVVLYDRMTKNEKE